MGFLAPRFVLSGVLALAMAPTSVLLVPDAARAPHSREALATTRAAPAGAWGERSRTARRVDRDVKRLDVAADEGLTGVRRKARHMLRHGAAGQLAAQQLQATGQGRPSEGGRDHAAESDAMGLQEAGPSEEHLRSLGHTPLGDVGLTLRTECETDGATRAQRRVLVDTVLPGGPADRASVRPGDVVHSIDGIVASASGHASLDCLLAGPTATALTLQLQRPGNQSLIVVSLERRAVPTSPPAAGAARSGFDHLRLLPHDLEARGPCFACLVNPAPRVLGNESIASLWPAFLVHLRAQRALDPQARGTNENEEACRQARLAYLRLILHLRRHLSSGITQTLPADTVKLLHALSHALPAAIQRRLPPPPVPRTKAGRLLKGPAAIATALSSSAVPGSAEQEGASAGAQERADGSGGGGSVGGVASVAELLGLDLGNSGGATAGGDGVAGEDGTMVGKAVVDEDVDEEWGWCLAQMRQNTFDFFNLQLHLHFCTCYTVFRALPLSLSFSLSIYLSLSDYYIKWKS